MGGSISGITIRIATEAAAEAGGVSSPQSTIHPGDNRRPHPQQRRGPRGTFSLPCPVAPASLRQRAGTHIPRTRPPRAALQSHPEQPSTALPRNLLKTVGELRSAGAPRRTRLLTRCSIAAFRNTRGLTRVIRIAGW